MQVLRYLCRSTDIVQPLPPLSKFPVLFQFLPFERQIRIIFAKPFPSAQLPDFFLIPFFTLISEPLGPAFSRRKFIRSTNNRATPAVWCRKVTATPSRPSNRAGAMDAERFFLRAYKGRCFRVRVEERQKKRKRMREKKKRRRQVFLCTLPDYEVPYFFEHFSLYICNHTDSPWR